MIEFETYLKFEQKCEKGIDNIKKYKNGEDWNPYHIWNSYRILKNMDRVLKEKGLFKLEQDELYHQLLYGNVKEVTELENRVERLKESKIAIEKIMDRKMILGKDIDAGIKFLEDIKDRCIEYEVKILPLL